MFRTPPPSSGQSMLEHCSAGELLGIFDAYVRKGETRIPYADFPVAWGILFSELYLTAGDLAESFRGGKNPIAADDLRMLSEFVRMDCRGGGGFVLGVIRTGGMIDRAALILIADPADLALVRHQGSTALHLLMAACDRIIRPVFIERAGRRLLSEIYDGRDLPVLFLILGLGDLSRQDLDAIGKVFTRNELKEVKSRNRTGKSALEAFTIASARLKGRPARERNPFELTQAVRTTNPRGDIASQKIARKTEGHGSVPPGGAGGQGSQRENGERADRSGKLEGLTQDTLDNIAGVMRKKPGTR